MQNLLAKSLKPRKVTAQKWKWRDWLAQSLEHSTLNLRLRVQSPCWVQSLLRIKKKQNNNNKNYPKTYSRTLGCLIEEKKEEMHAQASSKKSKVQNLQHVLVETSEHWDIRSYWICNPLQWSLKFYIMITKKNFCMYPNICIIIYK